MIQIPGSWNLEIQNFNSKIPSMNPINPMQLPSSFVWVLIPCTFVYSSFTIALSMFYPTISAGAFLSIGNDLTGLDLVGKHHSSFVVRVIRLCLSFRFHFPRFHAVVGPVHTTDQQNSDADHPELTFDLQP
jgi:hypothetical protein